MGEKSIVAGNVNEPIPVDLVLSASSLLFRPKVFVIREVSSALPISMLHWSDPL